MKDKRNVILARITKKEVAEESTGFLKDKEGNLALTNDSAPAEKTERQIMLEAFVYAFIGCLNELRSEDFDKTQYRRTLAEMRNAARTHCFTGAEVVEALARLTGVSIDLVLVTNCLESQSVDDAVAEVFKDYCPAIVEFPQERRSQNPDIFNGAEFEAKDSCFSLPFGAPETECLRVHQGRLPGMTGDRNIPRDPDTGRFISRRAIGA